MLLLFTFHKFVTWRFTVVLLLERLVECSSAGSGSIMIDGRYFDSHCPYTDSPISPAHRAMEAQMTVLHYP